MASCHFGHTVTHLITKVKQCWAQLVLGWFIDQMTIMPGAVRKCNPILWPAKALEKTPRGVIRPVFVKYYRTYASRKKKKCLTIGFKVCDVTS
jgi:hypothetical protein